MKFKVPEQISKGFATTVFVVGSIAAVTTLSTTVSAEEFGPIVGKEVNAKKAELGKRLFFDAKLSGDSAISCASCHKPEMAFTDGLPLAKAYPGSDGFRNTPTLMNTSLKSVWFHDGRLGTNLNDVTRESLTEDWMMNMDMRLMQERAKQDPVYVQMFKDAGYGEPSNGSIRKAIPEYLNTLTSRNSPFDKGTMSDAAKRGFELFKGKANCATCHSGTRFTDDKAYNVGTPDNPEIWNNPIRHATYAAFASFMGVENYMNVRRDVGAYIINHKADGSEIGTFVTPTLRELKYTAPYMHNGMMKTLSEVVYFYNQGGGYDENKDSRLKPLGLANQEMRDLVAFLNSLSGDLLNTPAHVWDKEIPNNYEAIEDWRNKPN